MDTSPRALVERFYHQVWNRADEAAAREILHKDFVFRASLGPEHTGPDGFIQYLRAVHQALGGYQCIIEELIESKRHAAVRLRFLGVHHDTFFGVPATGKRIEWCGAGFFATDTGKITRLWVIGDVDAVKRQLGAASNADFTP